MKAIGIRALRTLHRRSGVVVALLAIWLAISGIVLNHSDGLRLADRHIGSGLARAIYGIEAESVTSGFAAGEHWLATAEEQLFFNATPVASGYKNLVAAVSLPPMFVAAVDRKSITLLLATGELVERLYGADLPVQHIAMAAETDGALLLWGEAGRCFRADGSELLQWQRCSDAENRSQPGAQGVLPKPQRIAIEQQLGGAKISWQQLLLDLHSGKAVGWLGRAVADISAFLLIFLAVSGLYIAYRRQKR